MQMFKIGEITFEKISAVRRFLLKSNDLDQIVSIWSHTASGKLRFDLSGEKFIANVFKESDVVWEFEKHRRNLDVVYGDQLRDGIKNIPSSITTTSSWDELLLAVMDNRQRIKNKVFEEQHVMY